jgi:isopenicillin-N N-acyltransferase-like protein
MPRLYFFPTKAKLDTKPMRQVSPFPFITISGTPYERGKSYGAAVADRVAKSAGLYGSTLEDLGFQGAAKTKLIGDFAREIEAFGSHYIEEMRGIAAGSGVPFEDVVMINARTEIVAKARRERELSATPEADLEDGCTGLLVMPERSANGQLLHAQNWDWRAECAETSIVLRVRQENGPDFLTFVEAGGLARSGLNAAGISITANYLESDRDYRQSGVPLALIRRKVLEQEHVALAFKAVATTAKACSNNMTIGSAEGFGVNVECAPDEAFPILPDDGLIVHANHWVSPIALGKLKDTGRPQLPESIYRDWRVRRLLEAAGRKLSVADIKAALFDDFGTPYSVCRPPRPGSHNNLSATVAMVVMQPSEGVMEVAPLPALQRSFTRYALSDATAALAAAE